MPDLTERQRDFLRAAHLASWRTSRVFRASMACEWLGVGDGECQELIRRAETNGLLSQLPDGEVILTSAGMTLGAGH